MLFVTAVVTSLVFEQAPSMEAYVTVSELSDLLKSTGITARQAAEKADAEGIDLPYGTIAAYWAGKHPRNPSEKTLEGLAEVTRVSVRRLRRAAGAAVGEAKPYQPPAEANRLTQRQREALDHLIKAIVAEPLATDEPELYPGAASWRQGSQHTVAPAREG